MGQQSKQVGCPSKLTNELIAKAKEYLYGGYKENKGDREKIHQYLKGDALLAVEKQMVAVTNIANSSVDYKDFDARCMAAFNVKGQMQMLYPSTQGEHHATRLQ